jgi:CHAT domain-containing protein
VLFIAGLLLAAMPVQESSAPDDAQNQRPPLGVENQDFATDFGVFFGGLGAALSTEGYQLLDETFRRVESLAASNQLNSNELELIKFMRSIRAFCERYASGFENEAYSQFLAYEGLVNYDRFDEADQGFFKTMRMMLAFGAAKYPEVAYSEWLLMKDDSRVLALGLAANPGIADWFWLNLATACIAAGDLKEADVVAGSISTDSIEAQIYRVFRSPKTIEANLMQNPQIFLTDEYMRLLGSLSFMDNLEVAENTSFNHLLNEISNIEEAPEAFVEYMRGTKDQLIIYQPFRAALGYADSRSNYFSRYIASRVYGELIKKSLHNQQFIDSEDSIDPYFEILLSRLLGCKVSKALYENETLFLEWVSNNEDIFNLANMHYPKTSWIAWRLGSGWLVPYTLTKINGMIDDSLEFADSAYYRKRERDKLFELRTLWRSRLPSKPIILEDFVNSPLLFKKYSEGGGSDLSFLNNYIETARKPHGSAGDMLLVEKRQEQYLKSPNYATAAAFLSSFIYVLERREHSPELKKYFFSAANLLFKWIPAIKNHPLEDVSTAKILKATAVLLDEKSLFNNQILKSIGKGRNDLLELALSCLSFIFTLPPDEYFNGSELDLALREILELGAYEHYSKPLRDSLLSLDWGEFNPPGIYHEKRGSVFSGLSHALVWQYTVHGKITLDDLFARIGAISDSLAEKEFLQYNFLFIVAEKLLWSISSNKRTTPRIKDFSEKIYDSYSSHKNFEGNHSKPLNAAHDDFLEAYRSVFGESVRGSQSLADADVTVDYVIDFDSDPGNLRGMDLAHETDTLPLLIAKSIENRDGGEMRKCFARYEKVVHELSTRGFDWSALNYYVVDGAISFDILLALTNDIRAYVDPYNSVLRKEMSRMDLLRYYDFYHESLSFIEDYFDERYTFENTPLDYLYRMKAAALHTATRIRWVAALQDLYGFVHDEESVADLRALVKETWFASPWSLEELYHEESFGEHNKFLACLGIFLTPGYIESDVNSKEYEEHMKDFRLRASEEKEFALNLLSANIMSKLKGSTEYFSQLSSGVAYDFFSNEIDNIGNYFDLYLKGGGADPKVFFAVGEFKARCLLKALQTQSSEAFSDPLTISETEGQVINLTTDQSILLIHEVDVMATNEFDLLLMDNTLSEVNDLLYGDIQDPNIFGHYISQNGVTSYRLGKSSQLKKLISEYQEEFARQTRFYAFVEISPETQAMHEAKLFQKSVDIANYLKPLLENIYEDEQDNLKIMLPPWMDLFPFCALPSEDYTGKNLGYLADSKQIASMLSFFPKNYGETKVRAESSILWGVPDFDKMPNNTYSSLDSMQESLSKVSDMLESESVEVEKYYGEKANLESLSGIESKDIHVLVTHGGHLEVDTVGTESALEAMNSSFLIAPSSNSSSDHMLGGGDFSLMNAARTNLLILMACKSGQGVAKQGYGVMGLRASAFLAGSKNILVARWNIPEKQTSFFLLDFLKNICLDMRKTMSCFSQTQRSLAEMEFQRTGSRHPYWWAGYQLLSH